MKNKGLIKYLGIILIGCILLSCGMGLRAEEKEAEKVEIEVPLHEGGETKKYLVTGEERDRIFRMRQAIGKTVWAIEEAYRNREIDLDTKLILKVKGLLKPEDVPGKYKPIEYVKEELELKYHQDHFKRVLKEVREKWLDTKIETHSKLWSSEIFPYLKEYIKENAERERGMFGYEYLFIGPIDAYILREIDLDQMMLYTYGPREEWPARFIPPEPTRWPHPFYGDILPSPWQEILPLVRYSRYLRAETKEKIKLHRWKDLAERRGNRVGIGIDSPKEAVGGYSLGWIMHTLDKHGNKIVDEERRGGLKVYTPTVKIKGKIVTPEMYPEAEAWLVLGPDGGLSFPVEESRGVKEVRKEINLGPATYEKPTFDEKRFKEFFEKWTEERRGGKVEVDQFAMEYERGPGKIIRQFEIELELPYYLANVITIGAQNNGGESTSIGLYVTRYDSTDKEPPKVKIILPKDRVVKGKREKVAVYCEATDNKKVLFVQFYSNDELYRQTQLTDRTNIGYDENGNPTYADYYTMHVPVKIGKNRIRVVAYDFGGNRTTDEVTVTIVPESEYPPERRK